MRGGTVSHVRFCAGFSDASAFPGDNPFCLPASEERQGTKSETVMRGGCGGLSMRLGAA
jgi:hypothetical protein